MTATTPRLRQSSAAWWIALPASVPEAGVARPSRPRTSAWWCGEARGGRLATTASANSVNTLMRSIGTTTSAAVLGVLLTQMSMDFEGLFVPTETGFRVGLMFGCGATLLAAAVAATIPPPWEDKATAPAVPARES